MNTVTPPSKSIAYAADGRRSVVEPTTRGKFAQDVKEAFHAAFLALQTSKDHSLIAWAKKHPTDFYKLAQRFIPADVNVQGNITLSVVTGVPGLADIEGEIVSGGEGVGDAHGSSVADAIKPQLQEDDGSDLV